MGIVKAYGDESGDTADPNSPAFAMAAVIGQVQQWQAFKPRWEAMLAKHEIPELHMKRIIGAAQQAPDSPFAKFADKQKLDDLLMDASQCILDSKLFCASHTIFSDDLKKVLAEREIAASPYAFALYQTVVHLGTWALNTYPYFPAFQLVMDRMQKAGGKEAQARALYETDNFVSWRGWPQINILDWKGEAGSSNMFELQVADLVAWSTRRHQVYIEPWMRENKPVGPPSSYDEELYTWVHDRLLADRKAGRTEAITFFQVWGRLVDADRLKSYSYNEFALQNHVFVGRKMEVDLGLKAQSILKAGVLPLAP